MEFRPDKPNIVTRFISLDELQAYLDSDSHSITKENLISGGYLYVLKDLSRKHIKILGSRLHIPPSLPAISMTYSSRAKQRFPIGQNPKNHFILHWPEMYHVLFGQHRIEF